MAAHHPFTLALVLAGISVAPPARGETLHELIDREIVKNAGGPLSPVCDDAEFIRRVTLDLTGRIPAPDAVRKFLSSQTPDKRLQWVDKLLAGPDYPRRTQELLAAMLLERRTDTKIPNAQWERYLRDAIAANKPWNTLVGELLFSVPTDKQPAPPEKFLLVSGRADLHQRTQDVARLLLGRNIQCAQCHNHPTVDDFTQQDYFGLFAYLQETIAKASPELESVVVPGKQTTGPHLPGGVAVDLASLEQEGAKQSPRERLSKDLAVGNALFAKNSVNRFWHMMMGRGLVHPLDMIHDGNPASHPQLLTALTEGFVDSQYDLKLLLREIAMSDSYQRSSRLPDGVNEGGVPESSYRCALPKPLSPEQMAWSVMQATGNLQALLKAPVPEASEFTYKNYINGRIDEAPANFPDAMTLFIGVFSNPPGEPEIAFNPAVGHSLFLMNEPMILNWLKPSKGNLIGRLSLLNDGESISAELYLSVLSRMPSQTEQHEVAEYLKASGSRRVEALGELAWALIASAEFRSNH